MAAARLSGLPLDPVVLAFYGQVCGRGWAQGCGWAQDAKDEETSFIICEIISKTLLTQIIGHKISPEIRE